ncbi:MAG TPA: signal peptide peptidase SppA [Sandaracinaceae bacterium LLY-WYZ-13_1]|nr:signal peptide peptidase SppA [Sandaracinaceae bacterium LLY-WYZ-13_1]
MFLILARLFSNLMRLLTAPLWYVGRTAMRPRARWVHVRLRPRLVEIEKPVPFFVEWIPGVAEARPTSVSLLRELVDLVAEDDRMEGVVFDVPPLVAGWATCQSLRDLLLRLRANDKRVVVYLSRGGGNRELYVASAADRIVASPRSQLSPLGLSASVTYVKGLLDKAGLEVEVHRRAEYKTAAEPATRDSMSDEQREQTEALLDTIDGALREALAARPNTDREKVDRFFDEALLGAEEAVEDGLIDAVGYEDELPTWLRDGREVTPVVRAPRYYRWRTMRFFHRVAPEPFVAVVPIHGAISSGGPATRGGMKLATTVATLRAARRNPMVKGVVLHVSSPGGSALASDLIHREVERLKELKPVVACFGDVAASGGYYVAACADAVVAQPLTVTGSIGVVSARLVSEGLLSRFGVNVDTIRKAPHADMLSRPGRLAEREEAILEREIDAFYRSFVGIVAAGRNRPVEEIEPLARGRVWSGKDAAERGLVDVLGGLDEAVDQVRERLAGKLSDRARRKLRPKVIRVRRLELPPAEPRKVGEEAAASLLGELDPAAAELWRLTRGGERVLCYATGLPTIT